MRKSYFTFLVLAIACTAFFYFKSSDNDIDKAEKLRTQHEQFLANSPFKKTVSLSKEERKALGVTP